MSKDTIEQIAVLADLPPVLKASPSARGGLDMTIPEQAKGAPTKASEMWRFGDSWTFQFASLAPGARLRLNHAAGKIYAKIITGDLPEVPLAQFGAAKQARSTDIKDDIIVAGDRGALLAILTELPTAAATIRHMDELVVDGPFSDILRFNRFDQTELGRTIPAFKGLDAYHMPGFHLLDEQGEQILFLHFWTTGKGVDLTAHDHSDIPSHDNPAFVETHWVFNNGTGSGGIYGVEAENRRKKIPLQRGEEHGPFFRIDAKSRAILTRDNGSIFYDPHGWQAGTNDEPGQYYDFVGAYELNPRYAKI